MSDQTIYHVYNGIPQTETPEVYKSQEGAFGRVSKFLNKLALIFGILGTLLIILSYSSDLLAFGEKLAGNVANFKLSDTEVEHLSVSGNPKSAYQPPYDPKLPKINKIMVPSIGVDTAIQEATYDSYEEALKKGVWRVSDFGSPNERVMPVIMAAHRYGYLAWDWDYRKTNSFFNLPKVKIGDTVTIVWRQRKYVYEVYAEGRGEDIKDYSADLILYTCESLTGPVRIFKYARLLEI